MKTFYSLILIALASTTACSTTRKPAPAAPKTVTTVVYDTVVRTKVVTDDKKCVCQTQEDEIASLKQQLAKANAELERIKKRLTNPGT